MIRSKNIWSKNILCYIFDKTTHLNFICAFRKSINASKIRIVELKIPDRISLFTKRTTSTNLALFLIVQFRHISSVILHPLWRGRGETRQRMKTTYVHTRRLRTIYAVLAVDAPAMHFYPAPRRLSRRQVGSIDIISGLCTTRVEFTMRFRVHAAMHLP